MTELTVAMPILDCAPFVERAVRSVLAQEGVDFELIVVDDGSRDGSADIVAAIDDPRLRLLRHDRRRGIGASQNHVLAESRAPFVAQVDADDFLLPGALRAMVDALIEHPEAGQAHCWYLKVDPRGRVTREDFVARLAELRAKRMPGIDHRRELMLRGMVANHLRTYRRSVLDELGGFDESLRYFDDYEMSLRIIDRHGIVVVPRLLYCWREHGASTTGALTWRPLRYAWRRWRVMVRHRRRPGSEWMDTTGIPLSEPWRALWREQVVQPLRRVARAVKGRLRQAPAGLRSAGCAFGRGAYELLTPLLAWWPLPGARSPTPGGASRPPPPMARTDALTLYYLHAYPVLSQTFVQREVEALKRAGHAVEVCAHGHEPLETLGPRVGALVADTHYLPGWGEAGPGGWRTWMRRRPLRLAGLCLWVVGRRLRPARSFGDDRRLLSTALALASHPERTGATHLHSPWAGRGALVALLAARLVDARFTVQGRAYDLHRQPHDFGLEHRVAHADRVITNTGYNARHLSRWVEPERLVVIHNGVATARFAELAAAHASVTSAGAPVTPDGLPAAPAGAPTAATPLRLLCVARLTEQKGLPHLLEACAALRDRGIPVRCEIIGGARHPDDTNVEVALKLLRLRLGLDDVVTLAGPRPFDEVRSAYARADVVVLPAVIAADGARDIIPNTLLEAQAAGLPVVSTTITGIPEIVRHGESGLLVPPGDSTARTEALATLAADPGLRARMGAAGRADVEARFDIDDNLRRFVDAFRQP